MFTFNQLQNATLEQVKKDPALLKVIASLYGYDENKLLDYWSSGYRDFNQDKNFAINNALGSQNSELARSVDRYINWNDPKNQENQRSAFIEREKALEQLKSKENYFKNLGIESFYASTGYDL
jgi:hypothetical protein